MCVICMNNMVADTLKQISKQLVAQIDEYIQSYPSEPKILLMEIDDNKELWMLNNGWKSMSFEYEHVEFSFLQLCNFIELLHGVEAEKKFVAEITEEVRKITEGRVKVFVYQCMEDEKEIASCANSIA
ncbi:hypothetical protein [Chengkuizengella axinellae]|uniref:Uncharacterized protein n=1 Tax=Chengkuizengella axinellae TaxID=3064388 RepID=A0ABT9IXB8_9BACL|nr:hypothetical protein [Chengkuizengella sp. 2205SS18-9]MDP5273997.1 hypothetical protein [Chengkuizengella sp. 2205SS18-9]